MTGPEADPGRPRRAVDHRRDDSLGPATALAAATGAPLGVVPTGTANDPWRTRSTRR